MSVLIGECHDQRCGRSSSAAKKAKTALRISLARRGPLFPSLAAGHGRYPPRFARRVSHNRPASTLFTQFRSTSGCTPVCSAIRRRAPGRVEGSCLASTANRVARSCSSGGYSESLAIFIVLSVLSILNKTRAGTLESLASVCAAEEQARIAQDRYVAEDL